MLNVEGLRSRYGRIEVLHGIDLAVNSGEIVTVVGANGAGKTTLLRCLSGVQPVTGGSDHLPRRELHRRPRLQAPRPRPRPVARGPADLHQPDGRGEPPPRRLPLHRRPGGEGHGERLRHVPDPQGEAQPRRRRPLRRPAADARHRPRADGPALVPAPRRAVDGPRADHRRADLRRGEEHAGARRHRPPRRAERLRRAQDRRPRLRPRDRPRHHGRPGRRSSSPTRASAKPTWGSDHARQPSPARAASPSSPSTTRR